MAKYSDIKGFTVQTVSSDPAATQFAAGSWASDAPAPQATQSAGSFGTSTAAVSTGGYNGTAYIQTTIEYNGSSWSSGGSMNRPAGQSFPGFGTEPSGGIAGGYKTSGNAVVNNFESYNGTAFTESTDLNTARQQAGATGASATAGIVVGGTSGVGSPPDTTGNNNVEIWNGSSWTEISEINTARFALRALGSTCPAPTAVVAGGENSGTKTGVTEKYDGSSWSESGDLNTVRSQHGGAGSVATSGICFGGEGPAGGGYTVYANTEHFDGSTWTEVSDLSGVRMSFGTMTGTGSAAIAAQGRAPGFTGLTEIWSAPSTFQKTNEGQLYFNSTANAFKETITDLPGATWASGGNLNTARDASQGGGIQTAAAYVGGAVANPPYQTDAHEQYNGSSWTETTEVNTARRYAVTTGLYNSLLFSGQGAPAGNQVESWNGSSWTEVNEINTSRGYGGRAGTQTASLFASGYTTTTGVNNNESWDGTNWTEVAEVNTIKYACAGGGTQTSAIEAGGHNNSGYIDNAETWNGTSWTEVADLNQTRGYFAGDGTNDVDCLIFGGNTPPPANVGVTEHWNGTAWTELADLSVARGNGMGGAGSGATNLCFGGTADPGRSASTEEWNAPLANKTITAS